MAKSAMLIISFLNAKIIYYCTNVQLPLLLIRKQINPTVFKLVLQDDSRIAILEKYLMNFNAILRYCCTDFLEYKPDLSS
ncbi:MAG: hypothetical protein CL909_03960 [Deltaproteobacteria bacterium]|nr:hypothetical protein [Deltaproteobacteria bacterium]HCV44672.1 hypothetical protein [Deltaproteobacteria bacterium]